MSCGANHNRRVEHALNRRSTHVAKVATQKAKHSAVPKPVKRKPPGRPAPAKKAAAKKKEAKRSATEVARSKATAKARKKFHLKPATIARMRAKARATARAHAAADARRTLAYDRLHCHVATRRAAPKVHHHDHHTRVIVGNRSGRPSRPPGAPRVRASRALRPGKARQSPKPLDPDG